MAEKWFVSNSNEFCSCIVYQSKSYKNGENGNVFKLSSLKYPLIQAELICSQTLFIQFAPEI